jgi:hypothetical protein
LLLPHKRKNSRRLVPDRFRERISGASVGVNAATAFDRASGLVTAATMMVMEIAVAFAKQETRHCAFCWLLLVLVPLLSVGDNECIDCWTVIH